MVRITVLLPDELGEKVLASARETKRSNSAMMNVMAEDWYKYKTPMALNVPFDFNPKDLYVCEHDWKDDGVGECTCTKCGIKSTYGP